LKLSVASLESECEENAPQSNHGGTVEERQYCITFSFWDFDTRPAALRFRFRKSKARIFFEALKRGSTSGVSFPLNVPHHVDLVRGPDQEFITVWISMKSSQDESEQVRRAMDAWFLKTGAGLYADYEWLAEPLPNQANKTEDLLGPTFKVIARLTD
jgi:hypothetical protein